MVRLYTLLQELRRDTSVPLYRQLAEQLRVLIANGQLPPGTRLPASRELAKHLAISRLSVVHAYEQLQISGLLKAQSGKGTFVSTSGESALAPSSAATGATLSQQSVRLPHRALQELIRSTSHQDGVISFTSGSAPFEFFPMQPLREALDAVLDRDGAQALGYEAIAGYPPLRQSVREYVSTHGIRCLPGEVLITGGAQQGIDLILQALTQAGDTVVASHPTFLGLLDSLYARRLNLHGIPMDQEGMNMLMLQEALQNPSQQRPALIFAMPSFHNPTGIEMSLPRRRQLLRLASKYQVPIIEDGVFYEFRYEGENLPPLKALDEEGIVIHASTFSKNLLPGMRIGFIITTATKNERFEFIKYAAEVETSSLNQRVIHWLLQRGIIAKHLGDNLRTMRQRRDTALRAAATHFPTNWRWQKPKGGFFLWVQLPDDGPSATELYLRAIRNDVSFAIGDIFYGYGENSRNLRLNFVEQEPNQIIEGFERLAHSWRELHSGGKRRTRRLLL